MLLGPGLVTGASDDDPSGIGTYAQAGAALGFSSLWTALFTFPMMWSVQFTCAKIGMVTGSGLARVLRKHYSRWLLYPVVAGLVIANTINAGVDIGAIAAAINLLVPIPIAALIVPIAICILVVQIWGSYRLIAKTFKWLTLALFAYLVSAFFAKPDWSNVLKGTLLPALTFDRQFLVVLVGILGTTRDNRGDSPVTRYCTTMVPCSMFMPQENAMSPDFAGVNSISTGSLSGTIGTIKGR